MIERNRANAIRFVEAIGNGGIPPELLAPGFTGWSGLSGDIAGPEFCRRVAMLAELFRDGLHFAIQDSVAEGNLVALRTTSAGTLLDGADYRNDYHYLFRFDPNGRISTVWEYMNVKVAAEQIRPAFEALMRRKTGG